MSARVNSARFAGRVAIVTGGAAGMSRVHAEHLASPGADVAVGDLADASEKPHKLASCALCRGTDGASKLLRSPDIGGQPLAYRVAQLKTIGSAGRLGTVDADTVTAVTRRMSGRDIGDVAAYIAGIEPVSEKESK